MKIMRSICEWGSDPVYYVQASSSNVKLMDSTELILMLANTRVKAECREVDYPNLSAKEKEDFNYLNYNDNERSARFERLFSIGENLN